MASALPEVDSVARPSSPASATRSSTTAAPTLLRRATSASGLKCAARRRATAGWPPRAERPGRQHGPGVHRRNRAAGLRLLPRRPPLPLWAPATRTTAFSGTRPLVPDPLGWCLEQFKSGKLKAMLERAGYSGVADDLDENLVASIIPQVEARGREMEAGGIPAEVTPQPGAVVAPCLRQPSPSGRRQPLRVRPWRWLFPPPPGAKILPNQFLAVALALALVTPYVGPGRLL